MISGIALDGRKFKSSKVVVLFENEQYRPNIEGWKLSEPKPLVFVPLSEDEPDPRPEGATEVVICFDGYTYVFYILDGLVTGVWFSPIGLPPDFQINDDMGFVNGLFCDDEYDPAKNVIDILDSWEEKDGSISKVVLLANGNVNVQSYRPEPKVIEVNPNTGYIDDLDDLPF